MKPPLETEHASLGIATGMPGPLAEELVLALLDAAAELGLDGRRTGLRDRDGCSTVIGLGTGPDLGRWLSLPGDARRAVWVGEPLPQPWQIQGARGISARSRFFEAGRRVFRVVPEGLLRSAVGRLGQRAAGQEPWHRLDVTLRLAGQCDALVVTSRDQAAALAAAGVRAEVVPFGYSPRQHGPLRQGGERDVAALVLGGHSGPTSARRRRWIERWHEEGLHPALVEGLWGERRTELLSRTRVVLEVHRFSGTFVGIRLVAALAAGAVLVSEPMTDPHPFVPGIHFVEAAPERMASEARALLADEPRRRRIVEAGQALLREELTMTRSLAAVMVLLDRTPQGSKEQTASIT